MDEPTPAASTRARLAIAAGMAVVLVAGVVIVAAAGGGEESGASASGPVAECIDAWNEDGIATAYGRHNSTFHDYEDVRVTRLELADGKLNESESGECAVVFGAVELDREPVAAGQLLQGRTWTPFTLLGGVELSRVEELQLEAKESPNAGIDVQGRLTPL